MTANNLLWRLLTEVIKRVHVRSKLLADLWKRNRNGYARETCGGCLFLWLAGFGR
jgi:hypothetical protein